MPNPHRKFVEAAEFRALASSAGTAETTRVDVGVRKYATGALEAIEDGNRRIKFTISDAEVDRDNDTIDVAGWDLSSYKANPVVLWAHDHSCMPIAKAVSVGVENGKLVAVAEFATHPMAETVFQLYKGGFMRATSVGFLALDYVINDERRGIDFKRQELLEFSAVPVPANPRALMAASAAGADLEPMRKWMAGMLAGWPGTLKLPGTAWKKVLAGVADEKADEPAVEPIPEPTPAPDPEPTPAEPEPVEESPVAVAVEAAMARLAAKFDELTAALKAAKADEPTVEPEAPAEVPAEEPAAEPDGVELPEPEQQAAADEDAVLELADTAEFEFDKDEWKAALADVVPAAMLEFVREQTRRTINQMRGRLD